MSRSEDIQKSVNDALRGGDKARVGALRLIKAELNKIEQEKREELSDSLFWQLLNRMRKQRNDAAEQFDKAERKDLADKERFEIGVIESFLPPQLEATQIAELIETALKETGAQGPQDMGKVIGKLKGALEGRADMQSVVETVKSRLQKG